MSSATTRPDIAVEPGPTSIPAQPTVGSGDGAERFDDSQYRHLDGTLADYAAAIPGSSRHSRLRDELVSGFLPVAHHIAARYANRGEPLDDLKQVASLGLVGAVNRYRPERSRHFLAYAIPTITGEVRRHFRDLTWSMRVPRRLKELTLLVNRTASALTHDLDRAPRPSEIAASAGLPLDDVLEALEAAQVHRADSLDQTLRAGDDGATTPAERMGEPDDRYELFTCCHSLAPHLAALPDRERAVVVMRFYDDMTQTEIGRRLGISQMQVSRVLARTLQELRTVLTADDDAPRELRPRAGDPPRGDATAPPMPAVPPARRHAA